MLAMEHVLALVVKLYYKTSFKMQDYIDIFALKDDDDDRMAMPQRDRKRPVDKKKKGRGGQPERENKQDKDSESDDEHEVQYDGNLSILERLVSPLSNPHEFGKLL